MTAPSAARHVAFDLDGTLIDSRADLAASVNHVLATCGRPAIDPRTVYRFVGDGARALVARTLGPMDDDALHAAVATFLLHYGRHCLDETRLYPGMRAALAAIRASGRTVSVVTNKPAALAERILDGLGVRDVFLDLVGGDSLPTRKPDPAGLRRVARRAGVATADTLLVGDSPIDLDTAERAGSAFCGVTWGPMPEPLQARRPRWVVHDARDLVGMIGAGPR